MKVRTKLLTGCISLAMITGAVGAYTYGSFAQVKTLADQVHSRGLGQIDALRDMRSAVDRVSGWLDSRSGEGSLSALKMSDAEFKDEIDRALAAAAEVDSAGMPSGFVSGVEEARLLLARLRAADGEVSKRKALIDLNSASVRLSAAIDSALDEAIRLRGDVAHAVDEAAYGNLIATAAALLLALGITAGVAQAVAGPIGRAARHARRIAGGDLDGRIEKVSGQGEIADLMDSLDVMQVAIADKLGRVETAVRDQSARYEADMSVQEGRFRVILDGMSQGACLFDGENRLSVANARFDEMFGAREAGVHLSRLRSDPVLASLLSSRVGIVREVAAADGRVFDVTRQQMKGGGIVFVFDDVTERHASQARIRHLAEHDPLTDLLNRNAFRDALAGSAHRRDAAVLVLDLDGFKPINDAYGHPAGDAILRGVAARIRECVREADAVARIGGDEFAVLVVGGDQPALAERIARRIVARVNEPFPIEGGLSVGVSVGLAFGKGTVPASGDADDLVGRADMALYAAKAAGRNTVREYEKDMGDKLRDRVALEEDMRTALAENQFVLHLQPFHDVRRGATSGYEALIRWESPTRGRVPPGDFIRVAEETGMIIEMGRWVIREACGIAAGWPNRLPVSVNLSVEQFKDGGLVDFVRRSLKETGLEPGRLILEVTEGLLMKDTEANIKTLLSFRAMGVRTAMDDFGTGFSSLSYLPRFPFDKVKIDQSFVRNIHVRENLMIVRSVIGLCRALEIEVIAEGVEETSQRDALVAEGCHEMQGWLFGRPALASDVQPPAPLRVVEGGRSAA